MRDARIDAYARLLVERSVGVQNGWQVYVRATPLARPLLEAVEEEIARRGAYPIVYMGWDSVGGQFARYARRVHRDRRARERPRRLRPLR